MEMMIMSLNSFWNDDESIPAEGSLVKIEFFDENTVYIGCRIRKILNIGYYIEKEFYYAVLLFYYIGSILKRFNK
jgi:hypothetical protein